LRTRSSWLQLKHVLCQRDAGSGIGLMTPADFHTEREGLAYRPRTRGDAACAATPSAPRATRRDRPRSRTDLDHQALPTRRSLLTSSTTPFHPA